MMSCRLANRLASVLPSRMLRDNLLLRHMEKCPRCGARLVSKQEARSWLIGAGDVEDDPAFWPAVKGKVRGRASGKPFEPQPRYLIVRRRAAITALFLLVAVGILFIPKPVPETASPEIDRPPVRFRLNSIMIDGRPINPVVIQPRESDLVIIWADVDR